LEKLKYYIFAPVIGSLTVQVLIMIHPL